MSYVDTRRRIVAGLVVAGLLAAAPTAFGASVHPLGLYVSTGGGCPAPAVDPATKFGRIATANTYLRSLVTHDTSELRVAHDVIRTEEGGVTAKGAEEICKGNQGPVTVEDAVLGMREIRWVVADGDNVIAFYLLDSPTSPTYIAERFRVEHGLIEHIEAIFYIDTTGLVVGPESVASRPDGVTERAFNSDDGPAGFFAPANHPGIIEDPSPASRGVVRAAAVAYLRALVAHNARRLPLAPDAYRIENRRSHGDSAAGIRSAIASDGNPISGIGHVRIWVEGDEAVAMYKIATSASDAAGPGAVLGSVVWAATRLRVDGGRIREIESMCSNSELCGTSS